MFQRGVETTLDKCKPPRPDSLTPEGASAADGRLFCHSCGARTVRWCSRGVGSFNEMDKNIQTRGQKSGGFLSKE